MSRVRGLLCVSALTAVASLADVAVAQPATPLGPPTLTPSQRPTTSPYLNLAPGGGFGSPAFRYFTQVRLEIDLRRANARQSGQLRSLQEQFAQQRQMMLQSPASGLSPTGHRATFLNYGSYFPGARGAR